MPFSTKMHSSCNQSYKIVLTVHKYEEINVDFNLYKSHILMLSQLIPGISILVTNLLLHLSVRQCLQEWTPLVSLILTSDRNFNRRQRNLTVKCRDLIGDL